MTQDVKRGNRETEVEDDVKPSNRGMQESGEGGYRKDGKSPISEITPEELAQNSRQTGPLESLDNPAKTSFVVKIIGFVTGLFDRGHFFTSFILGGLISLPLLYLNNTDTGNSLLNWKYDDLVVKNFKEVIKDAHKKGISPIDTHIQIVVFDKETYENSPSQGLWTPRDILGQCILKSMELKAKIVFVDFDIYNPAPLIFERTEDENYEFLDCMRDAAKAARKNNAVIILPWIKEYENDDKKEVTCKSDTCVNRLKYKNSYKEAVNQFVYENNDVIVWGGVAIHKNPLDYDKTRHFRFYEKSGDGEIIFSAYILISLYLDYNANKIKEILASVKKDIEMYGKSDRIPISTSPKEPKRYIHIYNQDNPKNEEMPSRYIFHLAPTDITKFIFKDEPSGITPKPLLRHRMQLRILPDVFLRRDSNYIENTVVLIGSDNPAMRDVHLTPLGKMNGIFLIANGVNMLYNGLQLQNLSLYKTFMIEVVILIFLSLIFSVKGLCGYKLYSFFMSLVCFALLYFLLHNEVSLHFLRKWGILIDFIVPIIAIATERLLEAIGEGIAELFKSIRTSE